MAFPGPFHIFVKSLPKSDAMTTSAECAPVSFSIPSGGKFDVWTFVPNPGGPNGLVSGQFKNMGNGGLATARNGAVVVCRNPGPKEQTLWQILDNKDGTYLVQIPDAKLIWSVDTKSRLVITSAQKQVTDSEKFAFPRA